VTTDIEVEIEYGRLRGTVTQTGVSRFLGIPFAAPPTGPRRFLAPEPVAPWTGTRDAREFAAACPQRNVAGPLGAMIGIAAGPMDEDCLYLNVWTPGPCGPRRPVLVWVHGGGNLVGSGSQPRMDGARLAKHGNVVVVTLNYRLGALGFLYAPEVGADGNQALLDQIAALRWIRRQIAVFGGDPENITAFGQSAGAFDIAELLAVPSAHGVFDKAILMSGSVRPHVSLDQAIQTTKVFAAPFGGIEKLRDVPVDALLDQQARLASNAMTAEHRFAPTRDGGIIPGDVLATLHDGRYSSGVPLLLSTTRHEWNLFSAFDPRSTGLERATLSRRIARRLPDHADEAIRVYSEALATAGESVNELALWNAFMTDEGFRVPGVRVAERHSAHTPNTYMYRFDRESPALEGKLRACHSIDVPFVFGTHRLDSLETLLGDDSQMDVLSQRVMDAYIAFAHTGCPGAPSLPAWTPYSSESRYVMRLGQACELDLDPDAGPRRFWDQAEPA